MVERIKQLMEAKQLTSTQFADAIEVPRAIVSHILSGRNKPSLDVVVKILDVYRDVRMDWLLLGEGDMLKALAVEGVVGSNPDKADKPQAPASETGEAAVKPVEKVQSVKKPESEKPVAKSPARTIERIIIFYTDKTFDTYSPV